MLAIKANLSTLPKLIHAKERLEGFMAQASNLIDSEQRFAQIIAGSEKDELKTISGPEDLWPLMREEAERKAKEEPILGSYFHATILNHRTFGDALSFRLASKLDNPMLPTMLIRDVIAEATHDDAEILSSAEIDIIATYTRDPACDDLSSSFLFF